MFDRKIGISLTVMATIVVASTVVTTLAQAQNVNRLVAERQQLMNQIQSCSAANTQIARRMAMQGQFPQQLPCANNIPLWTTRVYQYDIAIARANGDRRSACQIEYMQGCENYRN